MNKYLEKIAVVSGLVKAQRRVKQLLQTGSHDFKSMSAENAMSALKSGKIETGTWGTNGAGVYAGRGAPAHGYQATGHSDRLVAFPGHSEHAVPLNSNHRFHGSETPVRDSVIPHEVHLGKGSYIALPSGAKNLRTASTGEKHMVSDMEAGIRKARARRIYDDDIRNELNRRGLGHKEWDPHTLGTKKPEHTGNDYLDTVRDRLHKTDIPRQDMRKALRNATGENGDRRDFLLDDLKQNRWSFNRKNVRREFDEIAHTHMAQTGEYKKYLG
jgi:hypothetical protein